MNRDEIMSLTYKYLSDVPSIRERIKLINCTLNKNTCKSTDTLNKLKQESYRLRHRLSKIINIVCRFNDENQRIICYRYFEKLSYSEIGKRLNHSSDTISRRSKKLLLDVGRLIFGYEDEFWVEIFK